jgi:F-type H+-transporting ATPase subunit epsilon
MRLVASSPDRRVLNEEVRRVSAEGSVGSFTLLPGHIDYVTALRPGILSYESDSGQTRYLAVDDGVLLKEGAVVRVACRNVVVGADLGSLAATIRDRFLVVGDREQTARLAFARLEAEFVRHFMET